MVRKGNIPNILTVGRIVLIFICLILATNAVQRAGEPLTQGNEFLRYLAYGLAILAGSTDLLDGHLARRWNQVSDLGALLDPLADKIFVTATMLILVEFNLMPGWIAAVVISREFMVTGLRMAALRYGVVISADRWGKLKTALQMGMLLLGGLVWVQNWDLRTMVYHGISLYWVWWVMLVMIVVVTVLSSLGYLIRYHEIEKKAE